MKYLILLLFPIVATGQQNPKPFKLKFSTGIDLLGMTMTSAQIYISDSGRDVAVKPSDSAQWVVRDTAATLRVLLSLMEKNMEDTRKLYRKINAAEDFISWLKGYPAGPFIMQMYRNKDKVIEEPENPLVHEQ